MQFYDDTNKQGLCQKVDFLCDTASPTGTDSINYPRVDKTREINAALDSLIPALINADGTWQFDDTNYTDLPRGKGTLVEGQSQYRFTSKYLQIEAIEVLDTNNVWRSMIPFDHLELNGQVSGASGQLSGQQGGGQTPEQYFGVDSAGNIRKGMPTHYDKLGSNFFLYPAPTSSSVTLASGLRVWFKRKASLFTVSSGTGDDTTEPGFEVEHDILAYMASVPYCAKYHADRLPELKFEINTKWANILKHYSQRQKDRKPVLTPFVESSK